MADYDNFKLVLNDLKVNLKALLAEEFGDKPVAVCANLPYYTSPILMRLLEEKLYREYYRHGPERGRTAPLRCSWYP